jgi:hypothetical protein
MPPQELRALMSSFTRALGVRCVYCHVGEEGKPIRDEDFAKDESPQDRPRDVEMTRDLNEKYLAALDKRADPPIGSSAHLPSRHDPARMLQDVLVRLRSGGVDSTVARYQPSGIATTAASPMTSAKFPWSTSPTRFGPVGIPRMRRGFSLSTWR